MDSATTLSWVDLGLIVVMAASMAVGLWRGLVFEVLSLAGWVVAYLGASALSPWMAQLLPAERLGAPLTHLLSVLLGFVVILIVWGLVARLLKTLIQASPLSPLDRLGGGCFGVLRAVLIGMIVVLVVSHTRLAQAPTWRASRAVPALAALLQSLQPLLPEAMGRLVKLPASAVPADLKTKD